MIPETRRGTELNAIVAERVFGYVLANAPCGDGLTRTDQFEAATMAQADADIRAAYAKQVARGMKLWPARYIGPEYSTDVAAAWLVVEKMRERGFSCVTANNACASQQNGCKFFDGWRGLGRSLFDADEHEGWSAVADTMPEAICKAALAALASLPAERSA